MKRWLMVAALLGAAPAARAEDDLDHSAFDRSVERPKEPSVYRYPVAAVARPLTLEKRVGRADVSFAFTHVPLIGIGRAPDPIYGATLGVAYGAADNLEISALLAPVQLGPSVEYLEPELGLTYRFARGSVQAGLLLGASVLTAYDDSRVLGLAAGSAAQVALGSRARLDAAVVLALALGTDTHVRLELPVGLALQVAEPFSLRLDSGLTPMRLPNGDAILPLRFSGLVAIAGADGPVAELGPAFELPRFLTPGAETDVVFARRWTLGVVFRLYAYL